MQHIQLCHKPHREQGQQGTGDPQERHSFGGQKDVPRHEKRSGEHGSRSWIEIQSQASKEEAEDDWGRCNKDSGWWTKAFEDFECFKSVALAGSTRNAQKDGPEEIIMKRHDWLGFTFYDWLGGENDSIHNFKDDSDFTFLKFAEHYIAKDHIRDA